MKSKLALVILIVLAGTVLWYGSGLVAARADSNESLLALLNAARAARAGEPIYTDVERADTDELVRGELADEVPPQGAADTAQGEEQPEDPLRAPVCRLAYGYPPYLAILLIPLAFAQTPAGAALILYWANVAFVIIATMLATFVLNGRLVKTGKASVIISLFAALPFLIYLLGGASLAMLSLVLVLAGLVLFRLELDISSGIVSAFAVFSPLGIAFGAYWFLKRAWKAAFSFIIVAALLLAAAPMATLGIADGLAEVQSYWREAVVPYFTLTAETQPLQFAENQSLWAVLMRHTTEIGDLGRAAGDRVETIFKVNVTELTTDYMTVVLLAVGGIFLVVSVLALCRRLPERALPVVGIEGALVTVAVLVLSLRTTLSTMAIALFPLMAAMYAIRHTDLRRAIHHVNYVALVLAAAFFYLALDVRFRMLGTGLAGSLVLWIAMLAALRRFRPKMVSGKISSTFDLAARDEAQRPIDLVSIRSEAERPPAQGEGVLPLPEFTRRRSEGRPYASRDEREVPPFDRIRLEEEAEAQRDFPEEKPQGQEGADQEHDAEPPGAEDEQERPE